VKQRTFPLGVDIGTVRTRIALVERDASGRPSLIAVASRASGDDPARAIAAACEELPARERRCVLALGAPDTMLRTATLPPMRRGERARAARFEAARFATYPIAEADVRVVAAGGRYVIGIARRDAVATRVAAARRAGLRPVAVDDLALALPRAFPYADALVDVGEASTLLVIPGDPAPSVRTFPVAGRALTAAVADALGVDELTAERRKHTVGLGGAGEHVRDALVEQLAAAVLEHRTNARVAGFADALERAVAIPVRLGALQAGVSETLPADVVRAASPDWGLAYGLALWEHAG
jgi:hypothetical protein